MSNRPKPAEPRVADACERTWESLDSSADERKGYCDDCALHVLNFARMTRAEIDEAVASPSERVCARILYRADGSMITADPAPTPASPRLPVVRRFVAVAATLLVGTATLGLTGCDGTTSEVPEEPPPDQFEIMGLVGPEEPAGEELGDLDIVGDVCVPEEVEPATEEPDSSNAEDLGPEGGWVIEVQPGKDPEPAEILGKVLRRPPETPNPPDDERAGR